jgi:hypothetical protein
MSILSDDEDVKRLSAYLSTIPDDQWPHAKAWLLKSLDENDTVAGAMMLLVSKGLVEIVDWSETGDGPRIRLSEAGQAHALDLLQHQASARNLFTQISGRTVVVAPSREM